MENNFIELRDELVEYLESIKASIQDMEMECEQMQQQNNLNNLHNMTFEENLDNMERSFEIAKTRISIAEMISVVEELDNVLSKYQQK